MQDLEQAVLVRDDSERCIECGARPEPHWTFCGRCGAALPTLTRRQVPVGAARPTRSSLGLRLKRAFLLVLVVTLAVLAVVGWVRAGNTGDRLSAASADLRSTDARLDFTEDTLESARERYAQIVDRLDRAQAELEEARKEVAEAEGDVASAQDRLDLQASHIATLKSCLDGVSNALSYAAYQLYGRALAELDRVQEACRQAENVI